MIRHLNVFLCLVVGVFITVTVQARDYHFHHNTSFGTLSDKSRHQIDKLMQFRSAQLNTQIHKRCKTAWQKKFGSYSFMGKTYPCSANFAALRHGNGFRLMDGRIKRIGQFFGNNASSVKYHGATVYLNRDFVFSVDVDPIHKNYVLSSLDHRKKAWMNERKPIHQNLSIRHMPYGKTLYTKVCSELPGLEAKLKTSSLEGTIKKRVAIFFTLKARFKIEASAGYAKYDSASLCGAAKLEAKKIEASNTLDINKIMDSIKPSYIIEPPKISRFSLKGFKITKLQVKGGNLLTKIIFWIAGKFKNRLVNDVKNQLNKKIQASLRAQVKVTNANIQSGVLFKNIMNVLAKQPQVMVTRDIVALALRETSNAENRGAVEISLQAARRYCYDSLRKTATGLNSASINLLCTRMLKKASFQPFYRDPVYANRACYSYSHLIYNPQKHVHLNRNEWWRSRCGIRSRVTLRIDDSLLNTIKCFQSKVSKNVSISSISDSCKNTVLSGFTQLINKIPNILNNLPTPKKLNPVVVRRLNSKTRAYLKAKGWRI